MFGYVYVYNCNAVYGLNLKNDVCWIKKAKKNILANEMNMTFMVDGKRNIP